MKKLLLIDDKMDNLITLSALLKNLIPGCTMITAQSGREGIAKARAERPDTILLDVKMPEMDGFETCQRLMADETTRQIPVIMITAIKTDPGSRIEGLECGANAFLSKPIDQYELVSQVKVALRIKEAEDALRRERDSLEQTVQNRTASLRQEIIQRKQVQHELSESEKLYRMLFNSIDEGFCIIEMIFDENEKPIDYRFLEINPSFEKQTGLVDAKGKRMRELAPKHEEHWFETYGKIALSGESIRFVNRAEQLHRWYDVFAFRFGQPETRQVAILFNDITERKQAEQELREILESLRKAVGITIQVMASAVEARDPYTSGHQTRSADLARAIAMEMGLPEDKIDAIRMAASIHDIGKLSIPAEILSKPTKLSDIEFLLIKEHARKGFELLQNVESPWPLAQIVYQHHERMDGSGYPINLKGDEILIEARILAVADVVEAMASHRPYRPGLGIDTALNEIEKNRGICYDSAVADACLRLFREKGFKLSGA